MNRMVVTAVVVLGIVFAVWWKIDSLEDELTLAKAEIQGLLEKVNSKQSTIANREMTIATQKNTISEMVEDIEKANAETEAKNKLLLRARAEVLEWQSKPPEVRYKKIYKYIKADVIDYDKATCEQGLELNRKISKYKYEEL